MSIKGWESQDQWLLWICVWIPQVEIGFILLTLCPRPHTSWPLASFTCASSVILLPLSSLPAQSCPGPFCQQHLELLQSLGFSWLAIWPPLPSFQLTHLLVLNAKSLFTASDVKSIDFAIFVLSPLLLSYFSPYPALILGLIIMSLSLPLCTPSAALSLLLVIAHSFPLCLFYYLLVDSLTNTDPEARPFTCSLHLASSLPHFKPSTS